VRAVASIVNRHGGGRRHGCTEVGNCLSVVGDRLLATNAEEHGDAEGGWVERERSDGNEVLDERGPISPTILLCALLQALPGCGPHHPAEEVLGFDPWIGIERWPLAAAEAVEAEPRHGRLVGADGEEAFGAIECCCLDDVASEAVANRHDAGAEVSGISNGEQIVDVIGEGAARTHGSRPLVATSVVGNDGGTLEAVNGTGEARPPVE